MSQFQDPAYLRDQQYHTADNLNARIRLHAGFSTNSYGWFRWVFDHFDLPGTCRVLELACGPGDIWRQNTARIPSGWQVILSDFSPGMVSQAKANLTGRADIDLYMVVDAQFIPYPAGSFEAVIANHCLYHIPDRGKALSEIHRVLVPGGRLFATTIGQTHMAEIKGLVERFDPKAEHVFNSEEVSFTLENGAAQLRPWFQNLERRRYPDSLRVTRAEPLVDFVFSGIRFGMGEDRRSAFMVFVQDELERGGGELHIQKDSGLFIARGLKPRPAA